MKDQFWKEKIAELQDVEVRNLTFAVPMQSRHSREVVRAVQEVYMRLRTLQLPVLRLHSDRAREFTGVKLRDWCTQRDILQTSTAGDESAGNGRCESELGIIQAQTRVQLRAAGLEANWWVAFGLAAYGGTTTEGSTGLNGHHSAATDTVWHGMLCKAQAMAPTSESWGQQCG